MADRLYTSPPKRFPPGHTIAITSSSPEFPSLGELAGQTQKKSALRSGSNAASIPDDADKTFMSASSLLRSMQPNEEAPKTPSVGAAVTGAGKTSRAKGRKAIIEISPATTPDERPPAQKSKSTKAKVSASGVSRPRRKKSDTNTEGSDVAQTKISRARVTKASAKSRAKKQQSDEVSRHFAKNGDGDREQSTEAQSAQEPVDREPAMRRRNDWTPPPVDTENPSLFDLSDTRELSSPTSRRPASNRNAADVFGNLQDTYGHRSNSSGEGTSDSGEASNVLGKRKLIELIATNKPNAASTEASPTKPSPTKPKPTKKKPRTLTEIATAAYAPPPKANDIADQPQSGSMRDFLEQEAGPKLPAQDDDSTKKKKGKKKPAKPRVTKRKVEPAKPVLLSPTAAMHQLAGQDFVFGTSSQLAREESPTFLRDLQAALRASNQVGSDPFEETPDGRGASPAEEAKSRLWTAGARDEGGELLELEVIDLVDSPNVSPRLAIGFPDVVMTSKSAAVARLDDFTDVEELIPAFPKESSKAQLAFLAIQKRQVERQVAGAGFSSTYATGQQSMGEDDSFVDIIDLDESLPAQMQQNPTTTPEKAVDESEESNRPNYPVFTDAQLVKEITSYGFKPVKKRETMIALLNQCWASKNGQRNAPTSIVTTSKAAISTTAAAAAAPRKAGAQPKATSPSKSTENPPPRPRGRPRKVSDAEPSQYAAAAVAIASSKRPRGRPKKTQVTVTGTSSRTAKPNRPGQPSVLAPLSTSPDPPPPSQVPFATPLPARRRAATQSVLEIADSDSETSLSSPARSSSPEQTFSSPPAAELSLNMEDEADLSLTLSPTDKQAALFCHITKAVTMAPRSTDPQEPSWYEKMLMYDPIMLEDLAGWLNAGQLGRVGYDGEVSPFDVKKWCESKSVCCLWRETVKGRTRKRL